METILFFVLSFLEGSAIFLFMFALFRFDVRHYFSQILLVNMVVSLISYTLRVYTSLDDFVPLVILVLLVLFLNLLFKVQLFYSGIMAITGYIGFLAVQVILLLTLQMVNVISYSNIKDDVYIGFFIQLLTIVALVLLSWLIVKKRGWVTFIPIGERYVKKRLPKLNTNNVLMLVGIIVVFVIIGVSFGIQDLWAIAINFILVAAFVIRVIYRKEFSND